MFYHVVLTLNSGLSMYNVFKYVAFILYLFSLFKSYAGGRLKFNSPQTELIPCFTSKISFCINCISLLSFDFRLLEQVASCIVIV